MSQLLGDMGTAAAQADNTNAAVANRAFATLPKKALSPKTFYRHTISECVCKALATTDTFENHSGLASLVIQPRPIAESWLKTKAPCGRRGCTLKKSGTNLALSRKSVLEKLGRPGWS